MKSRRLGLHVLACFALLPGASCERTVLVGKQLPRIDGGPVPDASMPDLRAGVESGARTCDRISFVPEVFYPCGHPASIAFSPDGRLLATGGDFSDTRSASEPMVQNVHLWRTSDGVRIPGIASPWLDCYGLAFSPDSRLLATAHHSLDIPPGPGMVNLWDVQTGALVRPLPVGTDWPNYRVLLAKAVAFSHDGRMLATGASSGPVELWRVADGARLRVFESKGNVDQVRFSPDDVALLVASSAECKAKVWNTTTGAMVNDAIPSRCDFANADFSPDGTQIVVTNESGGESLLDARTGELLQQIAGETDASANRVAWVDQNRLVRSEQHGRATLLSRDDSGQFVATRTWRIVDSSGSALKLGEIAVAPDKSRIAIAATSEDQGGFVFLVP